MSKWERDLFVMERGHGKNFWEDPVGAVVDNLFKPAGDLISPITDLFGSGGKSSRSSDAPQRESITEYPEWPMLELEPYKGNTQVAIPQGYSDTEKLLSQLLAGETGIFRTLLSGDPNWSLFNRAVEVPMQQRMTGSVLPQIRSQFGRGAYGGNSFFSGAREEATSKALTDSADNLAGLRMQYDDQAKTKSLQASAQIPAFANVFQGRYQMEAQNLDREINTHFRNQGLAVQEASHAAQGAMYDLGVITTNNEIDFMNDYLDYQQELMDQAEKAQEYSSLGSLLGMGLGAFAGPAGAMAGSALGGGVGSYLGGGSPASATSGLGNLFGLMALSNASRGGSMWNWRFGGGGGGRTTGTTAATNLFRATPGGG